MNERARGATRARACGAVAVALVALAGCAGVGADRLDARFVASVRADGHAVPPGENESVLVAAAHKICDRREGRSLDERRAAALTQRELAAVTQTFAGDPRRFAALALDTYCPS